MRKLHWIAPWLLAVGFAAADNRPAAERAQGFLAPGAGELAGVVTDEDGKPLKRATVHLVTQANETTVTTDADGNYKVTIGAAPTLVIVYGGAQVSGTGVTTERVEGEEAIKLRDVMRPAKLPKALSDPNVIPEYTDKAVDKNEWMRAWIMLDVSETGVVSRVKLLNKPGLGLDAIAVRDAFKLKFEAARNRSDKAIASQVVWRFDWPPWWWLTKHGERRHLPPDGARLPCKGDPGARTTTRDCSTPNMAAALTEPWIDRPKKK